jgi:hypothetical protein
MLIIFEVPINHEATEGLVTEIHLMATINKPKVSDVFIIE